VAIAVVAVLLFGIAAWYAYPYFSFTERFRRSKPALDAYAAQVGRLGPTSLAKPPSRIGYFNVLKAEPLPHGFVLQSDYGNPFDWDGLAFSTARLPKYDDDETGNVTQIFTPLGGNWYEVFRP